MRRCQIDQWSYSFCFDTVFPFKPLHAIRAFRGSRRIMSNALGSHLMKWPCNGKEQCAQGLLFPIEIWFKLNPPSLSLFQSTISLNPPPIQKCNSIIKSKPCRLLNNINSLGGKSFVLLNLHPITVRCKLRSSKHEGESLVAYSSLPKL